MKRLILMRHGQAENIFENDFDRNLTTFGKKEVAIQSEMLRSNMFIPDKIIVSPARRTKQTAEILINTLNIKPEIEYADFLYNSYTTGEFVDFLSGQNNNYQTIMLVAHNPEITQRLQVFSQNISLFFNTAGIAVFEFDTDKWSEIENKQALLRLFKN